MEQVYYTQCPVGYGLGIANGFQVKRRSAGYPTTGDFRHLGLRPFVPGTQRLAPPSLRYRRDGGVAEVAWLTPRSHEYETENGRLWGRPGGQFAHGLRLTDQEFAAIHRWPAGLYGLPLWVEHDPVRTLDQADPEPAPVASWPADLAPLPEFSSVAAWAVNEPREWLAGLLASVAWAAAHERTLFLIDSPDRLRQLIAVLTFAFPEALRGDLTFSTYHDRPEELSGFRIQGTTAESRPNRAALSRLGVIADGSARTFDPPRPGNPPPWAMTLAGWLLRNDVTSERAGKDTDRIASQARHPHAAAERWSDDWLNGLFSFEAAVRRPAPVPSDRAGWQAIERLTDWSRAARVLADWSETYDPVWWTSVSAAIAPVEARKALVSQLAGADAWKPIGGGPVEAQATAWGAVIAASFGRRAELGHVAAGLLRRCPPEGQGGFLAGLVRGLAADEADDLIARLKANPLFREALLLPVEAARLAAASRAGAGPSEADAMIERCLAVPEATASALEAIAREVEADGRGQARFAERLADAMEAGDSAGWPAAWSWALRRGDGSRWLAPLLHRAFARPDWVAVCEGLRDRTSETLRPALARVALRVADDPKVRSEVFVWCVEALLIPCASEWYADPSWPNAFLDRVAGLDLVTRLYLKDSRQHTLIRWIDGARARRAISPRNLDRLRTAKAFAQLVTDRDPAPLAIIAFPDAPEERRGEVLGLLSRLGGVSTPTFARVLDACRSAWPDGFDPGRPGLPGLGNALASALSPLFNTPQRWLIDLRRCLSALGQGCNPRDELGPDGLGAHVVVGALGPDAAEKAAWGLRRLLFEDDAAWKTLALDVRQSLPGHDPGRLEAGLDRWSRGLSCHSPELAHRFYELLLNTCDDQARVAVVRLRLSELKTLGHLPWWGADTAAGASDDLREAIARRTRMAPLLGFAAGQLDDLGDWLAKKDPRRRTDEPELEPSPEESARRPRHAPGAWGYLSGLGRLRWTVLEAVTRFGLNRSYAPSQWSLIQDWIATRLPVGRLAAEDRYAFAASVILSWEHYTSDQERLVDRLAAWMTDEARWDTTQLRGWPAKLAEPPNPGEVRQRRDLVEALCQEIDEHQHPARSRRGADADSPDPAP